MPTSLNRRAFLLRSAACAALLGLPAGLARAAAAGAAPRVVVIGGGFGGATAAKYLRLFDPSIDVTLVERQEAFVSCPVSNLVIGGSRSMAQLRHGYEGLARHGVKVIRGDVSAVYASRKRVRLSNGTDLAYDRLIVSPGIDFMTEALPGCEAGLEAGRVLHAWKAGPQTVALRERLVAMADGGVYLLAIPAMPYRCPPGPYERICQVASYFKREKPRSKVVVLDANPDVVSKAGLFKAAWAELYPGMIDYRPATAVTAVDGNAMTLRVGEERVMGDVINVVPPQRAGEIAARAGLVTQDERWCGVDWRSCESIAEPDIHVIGDATAAAPGMPKSGHVANSQAKVCAAAVASLLRGEAPNQQPVMNNTCFSFVSDTEAVHVAAVYQWDAERSGLAPAPGGGVSSARSEREGRFAWSWAQNIWADTLG
jgi:sulfite dehydrogenase